jgi:hypothetical protein
MKVETFFGEIMKENYPNASRLRLWWEKQKLDVWLKLPTGRGKETNLDFITKIPDDPPIEERIKKI